jgi:2-furoyl-CoA dehydrogenase large subunit
MSSSAKGWKGKRVLRKEDGKFMTGKGNYVDDLSFPGMLHAAVYRSPYPHAKIVSVDTSEAEKLPGVEAVLTGKDAANHTMRSLIPVPVKLGYGCLAIDRVRYVGEAVAAVAAVDRYVAEDAVELIRAEYEPLEAVVDPEKATRPDSALLYEEMGTNVIWSDAFTFGEVDKAFQAADLTLKKRFSIQRYTSTPLETFGCIARYDAGSDSYSIWSNDQRPGLTAGLLADSLGVSQARIRLIIPDIGGGFGNKRRAPYLLLAALLAKKSGKPVKWIEDRRENLMALMHACNGVMEIEAAFNQDGKVLALKIQDWADEGNNMANPTVHSLLKMGNLTNCYQIRAVRFEAHAVLTNKCPSGANRGIGKPFMCFGVERMMDLIAKHLGLEPEEIRFRNFIPPEIFPYRIPSGTVFDSGNFPETLRRAMTQMGYQGLRAEQEKGRTDGRFVGVGMAAAVEPSSSNLSSYILTTGKRLASGMGEAALVRIEADGSIRVAVGDVSSGQGYETTVAQIVADELGVAPEAIHVSPWFDSYTTPWLYASGNYSNKFSGTNTEAILGAARKVRNRLLDLAAHLMETEREDLVIEGGEVRSASGNGKSMAISEIARIAYRDLLMLPEGMEAGLEARHYHVNPQADLPDKDRRVRTQLFSSNSVHIAMVEVDPGTAQVKILKYGMVHDCGTEINPMIVEGLAHGATVHGIGAALYEEFIYDENGQFLTANFMDYLKPTTMESPHIEVGSLETPSPFTALGAKGAGEGGAIPAPAAIANAVEDALSPLGVEVTDLPLSPNRIWELIQTAQVRG